MYRSAFLMAGLLAACALAGADTLRLKEEVFVKGPSVTLGDVAEIEGENAHVLAAIELSRAARPGSSKQVYAALVETRLRSAGIDTEQVEIMGSRSTRATTIHTELMRHEIASSLRAFIENYMPWELTDTEINVPLPNYDLTLPEGDVQIDWRPSPRYDYVGVGNFTGDILVDGEPQRTMTMRASVEPYVDVIVAARDIPRGSIIGPADIETRKQSLSRAGRGVEVDPSNVLGMVARKTIFPGQSIDQRYVEQRVLVRRNQMVDVQVREGAVQLSARAVAQTDGRAGDIIVLTNPASDRELRGVVLSDGSVRIQ